MKKELHGFYDFFRNNRNIVLFSIILTMVIYAYRIFNYNIGIDTDNYLNNPEWFNNFWFPAEGRFGISLLNYLLLTGPSFKLNIFMANLLASLFLFLSNMSWLYSFEKYAKVKTAFNYVFSLFYLASVVWVETVMFGVVLCSISVFFTHKYICVKDNTSAIVAILSGFLSLSVYLPLITVYVSGSLIVYILRIEKDRECGSIVTFTKLILYSIVLLIVYYLANLFFTKIVYRVEITDYVTNHFFPYKSLKRYASKMCAYLYSLFVGRMVYFDGTLDTLIYNNAVNNGAEAVAEFHAHQLVGNMIYGISAFLTIIILYKKRNEKRGLGYYFSWVSLLFCITIMELAGGGMTGIRYLGAVPVCLSFLIAYVGQYVPQGYTYKVWILLVAICGFVQISHASFLIVSDQIRYEADYRFAFDVNTRIQSALSEMDEKNLPIHVIGKYDFDYGSGYIRGDFIGKSAMNHWASQFMGAMGFKYSTFSGDSEIIDRINRFARDEMKAYPNSKSVAVKYGVVIVKLSE